MACLPDVPDANGVVCCSTYSRRTFLRTVGATTLAGLSTQLPALADPLDNPTFDPNLPADKGLKPEWIKALYERGEPEVYTGPSARFPQHARRRHLRGPGQPQR